MNLDEILKGMHYNEARDNYSVTHFGNQGYSTIRKVNNSVAVTKENNLFTFTFKVYFIGYEQWDSGAYRSPYINYANSASVIFTEEALQSFPNGFKHLISLYHRLRYSVSSGKEWREIMRYFWGDWDFPETAEKKELKDAVENLRTYINKDTSVSIANVYLENLALVNRLYPE